MTEAKQVSAAPTKSYDPVSRCIYCGATEHSPGRAKLGDEHIIPEGLGGDLVLPEASCGGHEGLTSSVEQFCQKPMLGALRYQLGLPTKRPKDRPTTLPVRLLIGGTWQEKQIPVADYPLVLLVPYLPPPRMIVPPHIRDQITELTFFWSVPSEAEARSKVMQRYGATDMRVRSGNVQINKFGRMLAKIAHAYATAEFGMGAFQPFLLDAIEGKAEKVFDAVGGSSHVLPDGPRLHELECALAPCDDGSQLLFVRIRLFANRGFPQYFCIAGAVPPA